MTHANQQDLDKNKPIAGETDMVFVAGRSLKQVVSLNAVTPGTFFVDTGAKKLVLGADPTGKTVEATTDVTGLEVKGRASWGTVLRGLGFAHFAERGLEAFTHKLLLENNTFAWNAVRGLSLHNADNVVRGNTFACNGLGGMAAVYTDRLLFENNRVLFNNIEGFRPTWAAAGTKLVIAKDMTLRNNLYENNQAAAMWLDISCVRTNVVNNTLRHNKGLGIFYELCHGGIVAFNVVQDNGVGLMLSDTSGVRAWNNTFLDNAKAIVVKDTPRFNDISKGEGFYSNKIKAEDIAAGATWIATNNEFHNNLFAGGRNDKTVLFDAGPAAKGKSSGDMIAALDHNVYARTAGLAAPAAALAPGRQARRFRFPGSLPRDQCRLRSQRHPAERFALRRPDDYRLAPGSPLLKAGTALPADVKTLAVEAGIKLPANGAHIGARTVFHATNAKE